MIDQCVEKEEKSHEQRAPCFWRREESHCAARGIRDVVGSVIYE